MTQRLFENLPNVIYDTKLVRDITRRAKLLDDPSVSPFVLYPYEIQHQLRSDLIAEYYYGDAQLDWLIYMVNGIYDPYWEWYLTDEQLKEKLVENYGSVENSQKKIRHYVSNWATDDQEITADFYQNTLALNWKKYYVPSQWKKSVSFITKDGKTDAAVYTDSILTYKRKPVDIRMNTNRHIDFQVYSNSGILSVGELVDISIYQGTSETVGTGEVIVSNSSVIRLRHTAGNTSANATHMKVLTGEESNAVVIASNSAVAVKTLEENGIIRTVRLENFAEDEEVFWSAVTYFDYEVEMNEARKFIQLPAASAKDLMVQKFQEKLQEGMDPITRLSQG